MKVLVTDPIHEKGLELLKEFAEVEVSTDMSHEDLVKEVYDFDAIIIRSTTRVDKEVLEAAENLKIIVRAGTGLDNVDLDRAKKLGIKVENTPEAPIVAVSELTLGLMLCWARKIPQADRYLRKGKWLKPKLMGSELRGKTIGIVGTGKIGLEVAKKAKACEMKLLGYDIIKRDEFKELGGRYVELEVLLEESDFVSLHVPLSPKTKHMIGKEELEKMKGSAVLINTSRGPIVDEKALIEALSEERIGGACMDVYEVDPTKRRELAELKNTVLTPHIGAMTQEAQRDASISAAKKIEAFFKEY